MSVGVFRPFSIATKKFHRIRIMDTFLRLGLFLRFSCVCLLQFRFSDCQVAETGQLAITDSQHSKWFSSMYVKNHIMLGTKLESLLRKSQTTESITGKQIQLTSFHRPKNRVTYLSVKQNHSSKHTWSDNYATSQLGNHRKRKTQAFKICWHLITQHSCKERH